jgi:hypothetical protein
MKNCSGGYKQIKLTLRCVGVAPSDKTILKELTFCVAAGVARKKTFTAKSLKC